MQNDAQTSRPNPIIRNQLMRHMFEHQPKLYITLCEQGKLDQMLDERTAQYTETLTDLLRKGMDYHAALEIVNDQFLLPDEESSETSHNEADQTDLHETSA